jgi:hypothetical protein
VGALFIHDDTVFRPDDPRPHQIFCKVDARHHQAGYRFPEKKHINLPREGEKLKHHSPDEQVIVMVDDPPFEIVRCG